MAERKVAMIINGKMVGVPMFGDCNAKEMENIVELHNALDSLRSALTKVFDSEIADMKIRSLGECELKIINGEMPQYLNDYLAKSGWRNSRDKAESKPLAVGNALMIEIR